MQFISFRIIGRKRTKKALIKLLHAFDFNALEVAHHEMGINKYGSNKETGEDFFLRQYLSAKFRNEPVTVFDVGANAGEYSLLVKDIFPLAKIYAFEPNLVSFKRLSEKTRSISQVSAFPLGLGATKSVAEIYTYKNDKASEHATIIKGVMLELHKSEDIEKYKVNIIDLDGFCLDHYIKKIDFLKIDTEGFELEVLKGAALFLNKNAIEVIQFEFNEMNIFSKVFLHDFYEILPGYDFYRLDTNRLIPLGKYKSANEIFRYQNIVAILSSGL